MKILFLIILTSLFLISCGKDDVESSGLVGKWKSENSDGYPKFTFAANKTFEWSVNDQMSSKGTYSISGSHLYLKHGNRYKFVFKVDENILSFSRSDAEFGQDFSSSYYLVRE